MRVTDKQLVISEAIVIQWDAIRTLKFLENKLLVLLDEGVVVEVTGLTDREIDSVFTAYSRHLTSKGRALAPGLK
ncbi:MAG: hypothetical protein AB7F31_07095 [Parachlamydiales bacterium]